MPNQVTPTQQLAKWQITTAPARFISAVQFANHIRLDHGGPGAPGFGGLSDNELLTYVDAAVDYVESVMEASLSPRTICATC